MKAVERDAADRDVTAQSRFQCRCDSRLDEILKVVGADVPPAAADDHKQENSADDEDPEDRLEATPHRPLPLPLPRGTVMTWFGLVRKQCVAVLNVFVHRVPVNDGRAC